jgi:hypothetical protein
MPVALATVEAFLLDGRELRVLFGTEETPLISTGPVFPSTPSFPGRGVKDLTLVDEVGFACGAPKLSFVAAVAGDGDAFKSPDSIGVAWP